MTWPWKRREEIQAKKTEADRRIVKADGEVTAAQHEYEETVAHGKFLHDVVSIVFYHAERNDIVERFTKIARGVNGHA